PSGRTPFSGRAFSGGATSEVSESVERLLSAAGTAGFAGPDDFEGRLDGVSGERSAPSDSDLLSRPSSWLRTRPSSLSTAWRAGRGRGGGGGRRGRARGAGQRRRCPGRAPGGRDRAEYELLPTRCGAAPVRRAEALAAAPG